MTAVPLRTRRALAGRFITAILLSCSAAVPARAQDPVQPRPDTAAVRADTVPVRADTLTIRADSAVAPDSAAVVPDSLRPIRRMPAFDTAKATNPALGIWVF